MVEYKSTSKLRSTGEIFAALEENIVTLSTMKASKYFVVFEKVGTADREAGDDVGGSGAIFLDRSTGPREPMPPP
jgi:hypothetical protein